MRRVVSECVTLDGVMQAPEKWVFRFAYPGPASEESSRFAEGNIQ
jgi:hypothetical protein